MKLKILNSLMIFIEKYDPQYNKKNSIHIRYGLEGLYLFITKTFIILTIAFYFNILKELLVLLFFYNLIRLFSFGLHATKSWICLYASIILFLTLAYLINIISINYIVKTIINIICVLIIWKYSPADTIKKPIINPNRRLFYNWASTIIVIFLTFLTIFAKNSLIVNSITFAILIQSFLILPVTYKLFNLPYNNYKKYIK